MIEENVDVPPPPTPISKPWPRHYMNRSLMSAPVPLRAGSTTPVRSSQV